MFQYDVRACLKNHFRNLHAPLCGRFHPTKNTIKENSLWI
ncbi:DUF6783 domain-containing protein [Ruminococcus sp. RTP21484sp1_RTP21281st1_A2_RTP21281_210402]